MSRPELGLKRLCGGCAAKFYDLMKNPIACPKCGTIFEVYSATPTAPDGDEEGLDPALKGAEIISLEDADVEAVGKDLGLEDDIDLGDTDDDSTFLAEDEDDPDDVSGLIEGGLEEDEES
jgi:uncharacterized protein (TIGR02300 family)